MQTTHFQLGASDLASALHPCTGAADGPPITLTGEPALLARTVRASPITHVITHVITGKLDARAAANRTDMETPHQSDIP